MFTTGNGYNTARGFMTTPTKEQINEILDQMRKRGLYWDSIDYEDKYDVLRFIITEWEKIRNSPK